MALLFPISHILSKSGGGSECTQTIRLMPLLTCLIAFAGASGQWGVGALYQPAATKTGEEPSPDRKPLRLWAWQRPRRWKACELKGMEAGRPASDRWWPYGPACDRWSG